MPYDARWPERFAEILRHLEPAVRGSSAKIEHVGSTSVPGLAAKPIIDVIVVVADEREVPAAIDRLVSVGYVHGGDLGVPGREAFAESSDRSGLAYHHLYLVVRGSDAHLDHIEFRDHLRTHPEAAARYEARKLEVAHLITSASRQAYVDAKAGVVQELLAEARTGLPDTSRDD